MGITFKELAQYDRTKILLQKFREGLGAEIIASAANISSSEASKEANVIGMAVESYSMRLYEIEMKYGKYKDNYKMFIKQDMLIALRLCFILNSFNAKYPNHYHLLYGSVVAYIAYGIVTPKQPIQGE